MYIHKLHTLMPLAHHGLIAMCPQLTSVTNLAVLATGL